MSNYLNFNEITPTCKKNFLPTWTCLAKNMTLRF